MNHLVELNINTTIFFRQQMQHNQISLKRLITDTCIQKTNFYLRWLFLQRTGQKLVQGNFFRNQAFLILKDWFVARNIHDKKARAHTEKICWMRIKVDLHYLHVYTCNTVIWWKVLLFNHQIAIFCFENCKLIPNFVTVFLS